MRSIGNGREELLLVALRARVSSYLGYGDGKIAMTFASLNGGVLVVVYEPLSLLHAGQIVVTLPYYNKYHTD